MKNAVQVSGFATKTITIATSLNQLIYNLGDYQQDNFGENAKILAMSLRITNGDDIFMSKNDRPLIGYEVASFGYLNIVQDGKDRENVVYQYAILPLIKQDQIYDTYDLFFPPCRINWDESVIQFESDVVIDGTQDIELCVYYIFDESRKIIQPSINFDNGFGYMALKKYNLEVVTKADSRIFQLNNGRNPLGACALLIGMRINNFAAKTLRGNAIITTDEFLDASFLTMKFGSNRSMLDTFPLSELEPFADLGYKYFPIIPVLAKDYDWSDCQIEVSDKSLAMDDYAYLITFFYIDVNIEEWIALNK